MVWQHSTLGAMTPVTPVADHLNPFTLTLTAIQPWKMAQVGPRPKATGSRSAEITIQRRLPGHRQDIDKRPYTCHCTDVRGDGTPSFSRAFLRSVEGGCAKTTGEPELWVGRPAQTHRKGPETETNGRTIPTTLHQTFLLLSSPMRFPSIVQPCWARDSRLHR